MHSNANLKYLIVFSIAYLVALPALLDIKLEPLSFLLSKVFFFVGPNSPDDLVIPHLLLLLVVSTALSIFKPKDVNRLIPASFAVLTVISFWFWMMLSFS